MKTRDKVIELKKIGKSYDEIKKELNISKSTISYHCKRYGLDYIGPTKKLDELTIKEIKKFCESNTIKEASEKFKVSISSIKRYKRKKEKISLTDIEKKNKQVTRISNWRRKIKLKALEYKGGKCEKCGYNRCVSSMDFHHLDPNEKDFGLSGSIKSWEITKKELDKCILVCKNCHGEIHNKIEEEKREKRLNKYK